MKKVSLAKNAFLSTFKTVLPMFFTLITFPYAARILQVENIGKVNFSLSIVNYFVLLAGLGIKTYAIREGSRVRDNKEALERFSSEVFTINFVSTIFSYLLLLIITFLTPELRLYGVLIFVQSINIIGTTLGVEWLYAINEDYYYMTMRTLFIQIFSMVLLFTLVHSANDYTIYAGTSVFATVVFNIINFYNARRTIRFKLTRKVDLKQHLSPILIMFAMSVATTIYVNSDITMLGFISGDYYVGIYNTATKIYTILKSIISASILIALPSLSNYIALQDMELYRKKSSQILNTLIIVLLPVVVGTFMVSKDIVIILAGESYLEAVSALKILCLSLVFSSFAIYLTNAVLLPMRKEKHIMYATIASALANFLLNLYFIPIFQHNGAAITTVIAEFMVFVWQFIVVKGKKSMQVSIRDLGCILLGCICIITICSVLNSIYLSIWYGILLKVSLSAVSYCLVLYATNHSIVRRILHEVEV